MSSIDVTFTLPEELVEQAKSAGILDDRSLIAWLEREIKRVEAGNRLKEIADQFRALDPSLKPSPEEIDAEIRAYRAERASKQLPDQKV